MPKLDFDLTDLLAVDFDPRRTKVWIDTNVTGPLVDTTNKQIRFGPATATVGNDGKGSFAGLIATNSTDLRVDQRNFLYQVHVDYSARGARERGRWDSGWFALTADSDLSLVATVPNAPAVVTQDSVLAATVSNPGSQTSAALATAFAPRVAAVLYSKDYANMAAFFAARNAIAGPAVMVFSPLSNHTGANLRIDQPDTIIQGNGATITLPAGNNQDGIRVGVDAFRLRIENLNLAGAYATQTGTSRGIVFEEYTDPAFRFADRSAIVDCNVDGFLSDGIVVMPMRKNVIIDRTFVRDYGRYGLDLNGPDCRATRCNFGGIRGLYGVRINQSTAWISECGIYSNNTGGLLLTNLALGAKVLNNDIDNNYGAGLRAVGVANDALRATIQGNHFRSNSAAGDGLHPDIYLSQVSYLVLSGNYFYNQTGSAWRVTYDVEAGSGVTSITELVNSHESAHVATGRLSTNAAAAMSTRIRRLDLSDAGMSDTTITRVGTNRTPVINFDTQVQGTVLASRLSVPTADGTGFLQLVEQSPDAAAPSANQARLFARDNGSGKTQLCVRFASGAVQVLSTEP